MMLELKGAMFYGQVWLHISLQNIVMISVFSFKLNISGLNFSKLIIMMAIIKNMDVNLFCVDLFYFYMFKCVNGMNRSYLSLEIVHLLIIKIIFSKTSKVS